MTAVIEQPIVRTEPRSRFTEVWRVVRLHALTPSVFFGIPWIILGGAWLVMIVIGIIAGGAGADTEKMGEGMRYSWAVLSPQWYLVVVGVQAIGLTMSFALGFGATRRDFWLGTSLMFGIVSVLNAIAIATLVQLEKATDGWWLNIAMFDALWYGQNGWLVDFYTTLALQLFVLFIGASVTTVYLRWRMRGMLILAFGRDRARPRRGRHRDLHRELAGDLRVVRRHRHRGGVHRRARARRGVRGRRLRRDPAGHAPLITRTTRTGRGAASVRGSGCRAALMCRRSRHGRRRMPHRRHPRG